MDRDDQALPGSIHFVRADLEDGSPWPWPGKRFAAIVVTNYLHRPLLPRLAESLDEGGVLIYETFMAGNERYGRPSNPNFLLRPRELLEAFGTLTWSRSNRARWSGRKRRRCSASASSGGRPEALESAHDYRQPGRHRHPDAVGRRAGRPPRLRRASGRLIDWHVEEGTDGIVRRRHHRRIADGRRRRALRAHPRRGRACARPRADHRRHRRQLDRRGDRAHRVGEEGRRRLPASRWCRTTTSPRRKACTGTSRRSPKRSTCR